MGADLYIKGISEPARLAGEARFNAAVTARDNGTGTQKEVDEAYDAMYPDEGYFRDSYNCASVLNQMGLSWWRDVVPLLNRAGNLKGANLDKFIKMVKDGRIPEPAGLNLNGGRVDPNGENSRESWHKMFVERRERLIRFLEAGKKSKTGIYCSL